LKVISYDIAFVESSIRIEPVHMLGQDAKVLPGFETPRPSPHNTLTTKRGFTHQNRLLFWSEFGNPRVQDFNHLAISNP
jgi:hypothetical protein